jgi:DNA polymerase I-like protein with 3'-5' exonuclease and polymerase domains
MDIYNAMDCMVTAEINENFSKPELAAQAQPIYNFELALQAPVIEMMRRGFRIDPFARETGTKKLRERLTHLCTVIDAIAHEVWDFESPKSKTQNNYPKPKYLNPESTKQLISFFYDHLGIPPIVKWVNRKETVPMDRDTLEKLETYFHARLIVNAIMEYRDTAGQLEVLESEVDDDWRMRTTYQIAATDTTRFSSTKSIIGSGRNLQNVEESLRNIFIADEGMNIYGVDLEQTESREVGVICGLLFDDWTYLDYCESGDLHTSVARMCFTHLPWTGDIKADRAIADLNFYRHFSYRDACKKLGHGSNYFGQPPSLAKQTKIPVELVAPFQEKYFDAFPGIPMYHQWVANELQTKSRLTNIFGVTRDFFDRADNDETLRSAIASLPQSATAQRLNLGMWRIWRYRPQYQLLAQLHDAVYFQCDEKLDPQTVARDVISLIEIHQTLPNGRKFVIPGEVKYGKNWSSKKVLPDGKIINPQGLTKIKLS